MEYSTTPAVLMLADGRERILRYGNKALKKIFTLYQVSVVKQGPQKLFESLDEFQLSKLLVLGLDHKGDGGQSGITEDDVDELIDAQNMAYIGQQIFQALGASILKNALDLVFTAMENQKKAAEKLKPTPAAPPVPAIPDPTTPVI